MFVSPPRVTDSLCDSWELLWRKRCDRGQWHKQTQQMPDFSQGSSCSSACMGTGGGGSCICKGDDKADRPYQSRAWALGRCCPCDTGLGPPHRTNSSAPPGRGVAVLALRCGDGGWLRLRDLPKSHILSGLLAPGPMGSRRPVGGAHAAYLPGQSCLSGPFCSPMMPPGGPAPSKCLCLYQK